MGCYVWYSDEGTGRGRNPPWPLIAVSNVTAHPLTASVPITVLLYNGPLLCGLNVPIKGLTNLVAGVYKISDEVTRVHRLTKDVVVKILNSAQNVTLPARATTPAGQEESGRRRRRAAATSHDVELVAVDPPVKDGRLRTPIVASDQGQITSVGAQYILIQTVI